MALTAFANPTQPRPLVAATLGLYLWAAFDLVRALPFVAGGFGMWTLLLVGLRVLAAWLLSTESKLGWWLALGTCALSLWPVLTDLVADPASIVRLDVLALLAFPVVLAVLLLDPAARSYERVWFR